MKIVREHINEKFTQESDPVHDLGIGKFKIKFEDYAKPLIDEYIQESKESNSLPTWKLVRKYFKKFKEEIESLISHMYVKGEMWEVSGKGWTKENFAIKVVNIATPGTTFKIPFTEEAGYKWFTVFASNGKKYGLYLQKVYEVSAAPPGKLYEKFIEEGDPLADMNIGQNFFKEKIMQFLPKLFITSGVDYIAYLRYTLFSDEVSVEYSKDYMGRTQYIIKYDGKDKPQFFSTLESLIMKKGRHNNEGVKIDDMKLRRGGKQLKITLDDVQKPMPIDEKFTEESDPLKDMGIGAKFVYYRFYREGTATLSKSNLYVCLISGDTFGIKDILKNYNFNWSEHDYAWKSRANRPKDLWLKALPAVFKKIEEKGDYVVQLHRKITNFDKDMDRTFAIPGWERWEYPYIPDGNGAKVYFKQWHHHAPIIGVAGKGTYLGRAVLRYDGYKFNRENHMWERIYDKEGVDDLIKYFKSRGYTVIDGRKKINEKFTEESSDVITDMGIGPITYFKNLFELFAEKDKQDFIYTIAIHDNYIDFWFSYPIIVKLKENVRKSLFKYVTNIIDELGFNSIIINPKLLKGYEKEDEENYNDSDDDKKTKTILPKIVRYEVKPQYKHILKPGEYRKFLSDIYVYWSSINKKDYERNIQKGLIREHIILEKFIEDSDPIEDIGIGQKHLIRNWFKSVGIGLEKYTIDDNLNIQVKGDLDLRETRITELPVNLSVRGYLDLQGTQITELPVNLSVGGDLDLYGTRITELPVNLSIGGNLYLYGTRITKLPVNLNIRGDLYLQGTRITELSDNLSIGGDLDLQGTRITELPVNLSVRGDLYLRGTRITELPKSLKVKGEIFKDF